MSLKTAFKRRRADYVRVLRLGFPILVGQLGMIVVGFADNAMVGNYSTEALASASFVNNVFNIAILMCMGFTFGLTPLIGSLFSRKENAEIGRTLRDGIRLNVVYALLLTAIMGGLYFFLPYLGQDEALIPLIRPYYLIYLAGILPIAIFQCFAQWAYAVNSTKMPMWIILAANVLNVAGNYLLIFGHCGMPELGLTGAGISTLFARVFCPVAIFVIFLTVKRYKAYHAGFFKCPRSKVRLKKIFKTSMPVSLQMGFETGSFSVAAVMAGWIGADRLAAFQILLIIGTLGFCVYYSFANAGSVLVANAAGQSDRPGMRRIAMAAYHVILVCAAISSAVFLLFGDDLMSVFTYDPQVRTLALGCIFPLILYQLADATQIAFSNALRGTSNVMPMMLTSLISYVIVGVPVTYIFGFTLGMGLFGIYLSFSVSLFLAAGLYLWFFYRTTSERTKA